MIDYVVPFEEETPQKLIETAQPDVLVKGADYAEDEIVGAAFVKERGGKVEQLPLVKGWSTTTILEDIVHRYSHTTEDEDTPPFGLKIS
jgi:D-beta-D-heptose 7-phosphate kinase/D-beta-D-heptose 1-phosphate adenosyltransferase